MTSMCRGVFKGDNTRKCLLVKFISINANPVVSKFTKVKVPTEIILLGSVHDITTCFPSIKRSSTLTPVNKKSEISKKEEREVTDCG